MTATIRSGDTQKNQKDTKQHFVLIVQILPRDPRAGEDQVPLQSSLSWCLAVKGLPTGR